MLLLFSIILIWIINNKIKINYKPNLSYFLIIFKHKIYILIYKHKYDCLKFNMYI